MKKLQISLCTLLTLGCVSQSAQAMFSRDQLSTQALALRDQATTYIQSHPTEAKIFGATAGILAAAALYSTRTPQPKRGIKLPQDCVSKHDAPVLYEDLVSGKLQNGYHKDCLTELPLVFETTDYRDLIKDGGRIFNHIKTNPHNFYKTTAIDTKDIAQLSWFLYSLTMYKDQDFTRGTMTIEDNGTIYQYLLNYVLQKNPNAQKSSFRKVSFNPFAYPRVSTHFPESQKTGNRQYGIDMRFDDSKSCQPVLPGGQNHLVFGKADNDHTFIKFERHGLYFWDGWLQHALGVIPTLGRKLPIIGKLFGSNESEGARKEHMPADIKKLAAQFENNKTISEIAESCTKNQNKHYQPFAQIINTINYRYPFLKYEKKRFGNEAIITEQDLAFSKYYDNPRTAELAEIHSIIDAYQRILANERS